MLIFYLICYAAVLIIYLLCSKLCSRIGIVLSLQICMNKLLLIADNVLLGCIYKWQQNIPHVLFDNDCSIRVYKSFVTVFQKYFLLGHTM